MTLWAWMKWLLKLPKNTIFFGVRDFAFCEHVIKNKRLVKFCGAKMCRVTMHSEVISRKAE